MKSRILVPTVISVTMAGLLLSCNQLSSPATGVLSDIQLDTLKGFQKDTNGIWRDPETGDRPFADMPIAYREFWRYCFSCHSSSGQKAEAREARRAMRIDTWRELLDYGPEKLILAVKVGGMPLSSSPKVPKEVLDRVQGYLATWSNPNAESRISGFQYKEAENFIRTYCADCHTPNGKNNDQPEATNRIILDNYETWHRQQQSIAGYIDSIFPAMPPESYLNQPTPDERRRILQWIDSLSPNTKDGKGHGAPVEPVGAMIGNRYDTATTLVRKYCADCHTESGPNARQWDGWAAIQFDTYAKWKSFSASGLIRRLEPDSSNNAGLSPMPPADYSFQPSEAERAILVQWLTRGSPNSSSGQ